MPVLDPDHSISGWNMLPHEDDLPYAPNEVLLTLHDGVLPADEEGFISPGVNTYIINLLGENGLALTEVMRLPWDTVYRLLIVDETPVLTKVEELLALPETDKVEPNYKVYFAEVPYMPNDPMWENPNDSDEDPRTTVYEQWGPSKIGAPVVWNEQKGSPDVIVCVLDTGVQWWHEDLQDMMWINEDEIPDNGEDDDLNGFVDDYRGWDTAGDDPDITEYSAGHHYHGTACSGIVGATQDNERGISGMAPGVRIMGVKCDLGGGGGYTSSVIEGVYYATDNGADMISMSFRSYDESDLMHDAMDYARANGTLPIGASGNEDTTNICWPAAWESVIAVGATVSFTSEHNPRDEVRIAKSNGYFWGSNYGSHLEVMGFGEYTFTTYGSHYSAYWDGNDPAFFNGTSCATPMAAGAFALTKSFHPGHDSEWLRDRMLATADDLYGPGHDNNSGWGRVNVIRSCFGADRYEAEEDALGFVDIAPHDYQLYDSLHNVAEGDFIDTEDLYKITANESGYLLVNLDIYTWGEDLDLEVYSDSSLDPAYMLDDSTGDNHYNSAFESVGIGCEVGETYYIRVYAPELGDSTSYCLNAQSVENNIEIISHESNDPGFVHNGKEDMLAGSIDFSTTYRATINELIINLQGTMPPSKLDALYLYEDTNGNNNYDTGDTLCGTASYSGTNRYIFDSASAEIEFSEGIRRFFITADIGDVTEDASFSLVMSSYKDVSFVEGIEVQYNVFPVTFGPFEVGVDTTPPVWTGTVGIQSAQPSYESARIQWNAAFDAQTPPVEYNIYWTDSLPFDTGSAEHAYDVAWTSGDGYDCKFTLGGLINGQTYFVAVRAEDQAGNEEGNLEFLEVTPDIVSDPTNPQVIGSLNTPGNSWEVFSDSANQRLFMADYNAVLIVDVSTPTAPAIIDSISGTEVTGVSYDGTYVYAASGNGLMIIDPDAPGGMSLLSLEPIDSALDCHPVGNWVYVTDFGSNLYSVDVTDPASPVVHGPVDSGNYGYGIDYQDGYLYLATYSKPRLYDLADPANPAFVTEFGGQGSYEVDCEGDRTYVSYWGGNRFSIYDTSDRDNPQFIGYYQSNSGTGGADIVILNGYVYFGTNDHYIEVINVDNPGSTYEIGQVSTGGPDGMDTDGTLIFSAENEAGLKVLL